MKTYREALGVIVQTASLRNKTVQHETVELGEALGRICAVAIHANEAHPRFDNTAMDGFAFRAEWVAQASQQKPVSLEVVAILGAGDTRPSLSTQPCCVEIMTGAELPEGFDCVQRVEDSTILESGSKRLLVFVNPRKPWDFVRRQGEDFANGDLLVSVGEKINAAHVLALASQGITRVCVQKKLKIALISTGTEIVPFNQTPGAGQIRNSTQPFLEAKTRSPNLEFTYLGSVSDSSEALKQAISAATKGFDVIITTGAVSVGLFDLVPPVLKELGATIHFHKVAMRPGKPLLFAEFGGGPLVMGFPGNPLSSAVAFRFFLEPLLRAALGCETEQSSYLALASDVKKPGDLCCFWKSRVVNSGPECLSQVQTLQGQESFRMKPFMEASHWVILPEGKDLYRAGEVVEVFGLDSNF